MLFSSTTFLFVFLPFTLTVYYLINLKLRNFFLLFASLLFYAWGEPSFVFVMIGSILFNYFIGLAIAYAKIHWNIFLNRCVLFVTVAGNLSILFYYKYFDFFVSNVNAIFGSNIPLRAIILPIGISFFTFQGMSYVLDLYMGKVTVQKNPFVIALYISLFPQLIAGPIVRYIDVCAQIKQRSTSLNQFIDGVKRFIIGLGKKVLIANTFAIVADRTFGLGHESLSVVAAWFGAIAYTLQIFFDFSGYSDMAIGLGKMFGFEFLENFNYPYISRSITEFWRRWHISLSTWFKDYLYIPLGGNRKGNVYVNLFIVFLVTGLWHGAARTFVLWGIWHGLFLIIERVCKKKKINLRVPKFLNWIYMILVVMFGWVIFRAASLHGAYDYIKCMFGLFNNQFTDVTSALIFSENWIMFTIAVVACVPLTTSIGAIHKRNILAKSYAVVSTVAYMVLFIVCATYIINGSYNPFIYFNF